MSNVKRLAVGLFMTALSIAVIFTAVRAFAPEGVKPYFRV